MKNIKRFFMIIASALLLFAGCAKVESPYNNQVPVNSKGEYAITFTKMPTTKASVSALSTFGGYDKFQLFTWNKDEAIMNPFKVEGEGNEYKYDGVGNQTLQYFKKQYDAYNFIGIIPDNASASLNDTTVTVTGVESFVVDDKRVETDIVTDSPKEFLYAQTAVAKADYGHNVTLPFKHGNALLKLSFKSDKSDTELLDYTPHVDYQPAQPAVPGTVTTTTKTGKAIDMLVNGEIVYWPYTTNASLTSTQSNPRYDNTSNYGNMSAVMDAVNAQFVYYNTSGGEMAVADQIWDSAQNTNFKNMYGFKLASTVDKAAFAAGNDAFWTNASDQLKTVFQKAYNEGWRVVRIQYFSGNHYCAFLINNTEMEYKVRTEIGGSPAVPEVPESGYKGIRVFSADSTSSGFVHVAHTLNAKAVVTPNTFAWENRAAASDSIQFSLPATTVLASEQWSPTTFYAIPGDTNLNYFVVKLSYKYDGTTVYDVRVPLALPTGGLVAGKYYHYIINITSTGNGTNDPGEAEGDKDEIDIVNNPIVVTVTTTDYTMGHEVTVTI